jgi:hypothetical protein
MHENQITKDPKHLNCTSTASICPFLSKWYKAAAQQWEHGLNIIQKCCKQLNQAMQILTTERSAHMNWLYRPSGLHMRVQEDVRLELGNQRYN